MISLTNHDFQWGRSELVIIYPETIQLLGSSNFWRPPSIDLGHETPRGSRATPRQQRHIGPVACQEQGQVPADARAGAGDQHLGGFVFRRFQPGKP